VCVTSSQGKLAGRKLGETRDPENAGQKSWGRVSNPLGHTHALYSCFQHVECTFARGQMGGGFGGRVKKISRLAIARHDPSPYWGFKFDAASSYIVNVCLGKINMAKWSDSTIECLMKK